MARVYTEEGDPDGSPSRCCGSSNRSSVTELLLRQLRLPWVRV